MPGRKYRLEASNAPNGTYSTVGSQITAVGNSFSESVTVTPPEFFRVRIVP
jgi:hypothetical protein